MEILENIYRNILLRESVDINDVEDAIDNHKRIIINYHTKGEDKNTGARVIEVYAYGLTKAGNPVIRCFQPYGDTTSRVPSWKFFRLDRISEWQPTKQVFNRPADFYYKNLGKFNENGDETMSVVYKIANFGDTQITNDTKRTEPKTKEDVFKTDTELSMERLKQDVTNPIKLSDIKVGDAFKQLGQKPQTKQEPKTKDDVYRSEEEVLSQENTPDKTQQGDLDKLRKVLGDKPISFSDLNKRMKEEEPQQTRWQDIFNDEVEKDLEQMRKKEARNQRRRDNRWNKSADTRSFGRKGSLNREIDNNF